MQIRPFLCSRLLLLVAAIALCSTRLAAVATAAVTRTEANVMAELSFTAARPHADPFRDVTLDVVFTAPDGKTTFRVPAFWAGKDVWKVRYASAVVGTHTFRSECSDATDAGLHGVTGSVEITKYTGDNPLYAHGPLRVSENRRYLAHADGTPFFWLGDTWWMGLCHRLHWPDEFKTLAADRKGKGFNVIQIVAGLYPDMHPFDPRGANETGFPWEAHYARIRPEYFDAADQRLMYLVDQGFTPCIVGAWGYFIPWMGTENMKLHWRYLIARYGALPVVWCAAGEANLPWYLASGFPYDAREQVTQWTQVMRYIRDTDPYHRPLTVHPTGLGRLSARHATDDVRLLDFDMLQTPHAMREAVAPTVNTVRQSYADKPVMPVIDGEASYEMLNGTITAEWSRRMFWLCMTNGAAGHTYGANGIWQCNRRGEPHGPSPTAGSPPSGYGTIAWDEAMNLPGSRQVALGKKLFEQFEWQKFEPHPEWVAFASVPPVSFDGCSWIWYPEGDPAKDAPAGKRYFRREFELPKEAVVREASLRITADDRFSVRVNGQQLGASAQRPEAWRMSEQFDVEAALKPGKNVILVEAENLPARGANPAGLLACLEISLVNNGSLRVVSDGTWRSSTTNTAVSDTRGPSDPEWPAAAVVAKYGEPPWGKLEPRGGEGPFAPQCTGTADGVRLVYVPDRQPVILRNLGSRTTWSARSFNPVTGETVALPSVESTEQGLAECRPLAGTDVDWVLILEPAKKQTK